MVRAATLGITGLLGLSIVLAIWFELDEDWMWKLIAVFSVLASCGTVVTPILALIEKLKHKDMPSAMDARVSVSLTCPRCNTTQTIRAGRAKCESCGLRIELKIQELRCACGYLL